MTKTRTTQTTIKQLKAQLKESSEYTNQERIRFTKYPLPNTFQAEFNINVDKRLFTCGDLQVMLLITLGKLEKFPLEPMTLEQVFSLCRSGRAMNDVFFFDFRKGGEFKITYQPKDSDRFSSIMNGPKLSLYDMVSYSKARFVADMNNCE